MSSHDTLDAFARAISGALAPQWFDRFEKSFVLIKS
jgi:hypothetical protein